MNLRRPVLLAMALAVAVLSVGCSSESDTKVLTRDPADTVPVGPRPTAPGARPTVAGDANATAANPALTGSVDIPELVRRLDALQGESDVCTLLTGRALADVTGADINLSSLLRDPDGFRQLFGGLQRTYGHLVDIAPSDLDPPLVVLGDLWTSLARTDPSSEAARSTVVNAIGSQKVQAANDAVASWISRNCRS